MFGFDVDIVDHGCWTQFTDAMLASGNFMDGDADHRRCILTAAKLGRSLCGVYAGNRGWIPNDAAMTIEMLARGARSLTTTECSGPGLMRVYTLPEPARNLLAMQ